MVNKDKYNKRTEKITINVKYLKTFYSIISMDILK